VVVLSMPSIDGAVGTMFASLAGPFVGCSGPAFVGSIAPSPTSIVNLMPPSSSARLQHPLRLSEHGALILGRVGLGLDDVDVLIGLVAELLGGKWGRFPGT
jgi:hypothetical protein